MADIFSMLGVGGVTGKELRRAYRRAVAREHPDNGGNLERFLALQKAWEAYTRGGAVGVVKCGVVRHAGSVLRYRKVD